MTRRTFAALAGFLPLRATAETKAEQGQRTLDETVRALGGQNFLRMHDRSEAGRVYSFYRERLSGLSRARIYTQYVDNPKPGQLGIRERQAFGNKKEENGATLFMEGQGFEITYKGARPLADALIERYRQSTWHNFFYIARMRLKEPGLIFEYTGKDVIENQSVDILDITDAQNETVTVYLSSTTKLPVRQRFYRRDPLTHERIQEVTRFSKYKLSNTGVQWPLDLERERDTEKLAEIYDDTLTTDTGLSESLFELPQGIKMLKGTAAG